MNSLKRSLVFLLIVLISITACVNKNNESENETGDSTVLIINKEQEITGSLPSWNNTKTRQRITGFVEDVSTKESTSYVDPENRIAVFDIDGTLWPEKPTYFQIEFILYRIKQLAPKHPEWKKDKLLQAAVKHDLNTLRKKFGAKGLSKLTAIAQSGMTTDEFELMVRNWIKKAKHPVTGKLFSEMVYQPMTELIKYLQNNDFKVYILSDGDVYFMRAIAEDLFGIPEEQVTGSYKKLEYKKINGKPVLIILPEILFADDVENKPVAIYQVVGKKPILSFGNSDRDLQMLEWCSAGKAESLPALIHHTDAKREWAYDRQSRTGTLNTGLDKAAKKGWLVVDMKKDWKVVYPYKMTGQTAKQ